MNKFLLALIFSLTLLSSCGKPSPSVQISDNWVRATEDGQDVGAAYMTLTSNTDTTLTSVESSVSDSIEIHSMTMDNGVMKMRMLDELALKAGKPTELAPGGYHLMLFDLKKALKAGEEVSFTLHFKDAQGKETVVNVNSPIKAE
jgi:copper(I)-binding protein